MADATLAQAFAAAALDWIVPQWNAPGRVHAFVTTRNGGASRGDHATLDVGSAVAARDADPRAVAENHRRIAAFLPAPAVWLEQVHGQDVVTVDAANVDSLRITPRYADALVTRLRGVVLAIRVADCIPVLLASRNGEVVGTAHAGWRGLAAGVLEAALSAMSVPANEICAWLGPSIGASAFEVGADVHAALCANDLHADSHFRPLRNGKWMADLHGLARRRLQVAGVTEIAADNSCTYRSPQRFFSFRRDGATGRMAALIWLSRG